MNRFELGEHVKLNAKAIKNQLHYPQGMFPRYVKFVESNKNTVFTINNYDASGMYGLKHGDDVIDWIFSTSQLIRVKG